MPRFKVSKPLALPLALGPSAEGGKGEEDIADVVSAARLYSLAIEGGRLSSADLSAEAANEKWREQ